MKDILKALGIAIGALALGAFLMFACVGCMSTEKHRRKAERQLNEAYYFFPDIVGNKCNIWFPIKVKDSIRTVYKPGKVIPGETRYVTVDCDSVIKAKPRNLNSGTSNLGLAKVPCPPCDSVTPDTIDNYRGQIQESTAALEAERYKLATAMKELAKAEADRKQAQKDKDWWKSAALWTWGVLALYVIIRLVLWYFGANLRALKAGRK